ncbi:MAG TPA: discoidin domain-containing protein, partial [Longimicrobiaceae bacterium]|nr:discoidin domain-containing protein [Longimicrobiaceae bacterium]
VPELESLAGSAVASRPERGVHLVGDRIVTRLQNPPNPPLGGLSPAQQDLGRQGQAIYSQLCASCHGPSGTGIQIAGGMVGSSLAGSEGVVGHRDHVIKALVYGIQGPDAQMPAMGENPDEWVAAVSSYIRNTFSNQAPPISPEQVAAVRAANAGRSAPFTYAQLVASIPVLLEPQQNWRVTASHSARMVVGATAEPAGAFTFEGWTTGRAQEAGMWFQVELPAATRLTEIEFTSPTQGGRGNPPRRAAPQAYRVETSMNGTSWTSVAEGQPEGTAATTITFEPVQARFVRITQTASAEDAPVWTMHRLKLYAPPGTQQ